MNISEEANLEYLRAELAITKERSRIAPLAADLMARPALSFHDACALLDIPASTMHEVNREFPLPSFKIGRRIYIMRDDFIDWLDNLSGQTAVVPKLTKRRKPRVEVA